VRGHAHNHRAVAGIGRVDGDAGMCLAQHPRQVLLALLDRSRPYVRTIEFKEVEGAQSRHILNWEAVRPTAVYRKLVSEEAAPFLGFAVDLMRRFMPDADRPALIMAAVWLVGQCNVFIRYREQLALPPVSLKLDEPGVDRLSALISAWALAGLGQANVHGSRS
jgi:hypothetical protein